MATQSGMFNLFSQYTDEQLYDILHSKKHTKEAKETANDILTKRRNRELVSVKNESIRLRAIQESQSITTCPTFENRNIEKYLGAVSATEIFFVGDLKGGELQKQEILFDKAFQNANKKIFNQAICFGGNAVVGMQTTFTSLGNLNYMIVLVTGTAVLLSEEDKV